MQFYTYLHCKPDGTIFYVGKGVDRRSHSKKDRSKYHRNIVSKYGWENIQVHVFPCVSEAQALADEIQQIAQLRREGHELCNITDGGEGCSGMIHSAETRLKITAALQGRKRGPHSEAHKKALSDANKGQAPSEASRKASSVANKGRKHSDEMRAKISALHTGLKRPPRTAGWLAKQSDTKRGKPWSEARRTAQLKRNQSI